MLENNERNLQKKFKFLLQHLVSLWIVSSHKADKALIQFGNVKTDLQKAGIVWVGNDTATIRNNQIYEKSKDQNFLKFLLRLDSLLQNIFQRIFEIWYFISRIK